MDHNLWKKLVQINTIKNQCRLASKSISVVGCFLFRLGRCVLMLCLLTCICRNKHLHKMRNMWKIISPKPSAEEMKRLCSIANKTECLERLKEIFAISSNKLWGIKLTPLGLGLQNWIKNVKKTAFQSQLQLIVQYKINVPYCRDLGTSRLEGLKRRANKWVVEFHFLWV